MVCQLTTSAVNLNIKKAINFINHFCSSMGSNLFRDGAKISFTAASWTIRLITVGRSLQSRLFVYIIWGEYHEFRIVQHFRRVIVPACWSSWPLLFKRGVKSNIHPSTPHPPAPQIIPLSACHFTGQHYFPNESALFWTDPNQKNIWGWWVDLCGTEIGKSATF